MKTDGLFTTHAFTIPVKSNKPFNLVFFGDLHWDSPMFARDKWKEFLSYAKGLKNAWFFGMGDYLDSTSTSERACLADCEFHDTTTDDLRKISEDKVKHLAKELAFMKGRLIGLVNGNHYFAFQDGTNTDMRLCGLLDCKYLGVSTFTRLTLDCFGRKTTLDIWAHHGAGGSRLPGGSLNRVEQMRETAEADVYIMGHDHKRGVWPASPRFHLAPNSKGDMRLKTRQQWLIRSGSFLNSYESGKRSYNVDAGRGPSSIGHVELIISLDDSKRKDGESQEVTIRGLA